MRKMCAWIIAQILVEFEQAHLDKVKNNETVVSCIANSPGKYSSRRISLVNVIIKTC